MIKPQYIGLSGYIGLSAWSGVCGGRLCDLLVLLLWVSQAKSLRDLACDNRLPDEYIFLYAYDCPPACLTTACARAGQLWARALQLAPAWQLRALRAPVAADAPSKKAAAE